MALTDPPAEPTMAGGSEAYVELLRQYIFVYLRTVFVPEVNAFAAGLAGIAPTVTAAIAMSKYKGVYNPATTYAIGDGVSYNTVIYIKNSNAAAGTTPVNGADWEEIETLPLQTGNANKMLFTNGVAPSWVEGVLATRVITAGSGLTGGGNLTADRTISVDIASTAEVRARAAGGKLITPLAIANASAPVVIADAATIAVDWTTFINGVVTMAGNRSLGAPSNGVPGTTATLLIKGNSGTARTLTFNAVYKGLLPVITDATSTQWYLLTVYCVDATHFVVTSVEAL